MSTREEMTSVPAGKSKELEELENFDWFNFKSTAPVEPFQPVFVSIMQLTGTEEPYDRKLRMLRQLSTACTACSMCELGLKEAVKNNTARDPHVFSNLNPTRFMVIGQNPGWNELEKREPFVGAAGANFDKEIAKHGLSREDFYICNTVRCFTQGNVKPTDKHKKRCEPFLQMEISLIKPRLVIALGAVAFSQLCPETEFNKGLKSITKSSVYNDVPVFAIYHPSPLNFRDGTRKEAFASQIQVMCALVKQLKKRDVLPV
jgi:uracil-DNA glycosylase family 4